MKAGHRKPKNQWTGDERKDANLDQQLKSLIMSVLPDDQMNSIINPDDEKDTRSSHEYLNDLEEEYQARDLLAKSKRFFKKAKYNKVKAKLVLLSSSSSASKASMVKNKGLIVEAYEWDEEEVSSDDNEMVEVKVLMALAEENNVISKEGARNDESSVCSILLPPLKKLDADEPIFGPKTIKLILSPRSINHENYTLVIVDEYSRYTWVYFLKKKSQAPKTIMSFIKRVENQNDIKVKQLRTDNGTEFRNSTLVKFYDEKEISQNFSSPYTPEQNGKFDEKANDGYLLRYSLVSKAFRVFNTRRQQNEETYPHLIKALRLSNSQNPHLTTSTLLNQKDIHQMNNFILINLLKEDTSAQNTTISSPPLHVPLVVTLAPQDRWSQDKHIKLVNIIDFLSEEVPKKVSKALKHPGWVDAMQDELNQFSRNKI
nr:retrovirus-related Pol polyprotein from transposon TNT 1-94 [Tanacetum cinerariifolium]